MRWLFLGLLIVNALYFIWSQQDFTNNAIEDKPVVLPSKATQGQVQLVSEVPELQKQPLSAGLRQEQAEIMLLGGFADEQVAQKLQQRLVSLDIQSKITVLDSQVDIEYWVYLAPLASRQASVRQLKEMQARKIDGYLITQGDLTNGISLGMFAREDSAQSVAERLKEAEIIQFMIEEVITNYLSNAIHYVKDDGIIKVWYERKKNTLRVNVYNDGDIISDEDLDKLFIKFYKTDPARTRDYGGSGIGLSIVAAIMKAHDKDYGVYNSENGVTFYFEVDTHSEV